MGDPRLQRGTSEIAYRVQEYSSKRVISKLSPEGRIKFKKLKARIPGREHTILREPEPMVSPAQKSNGSRWPWGGGAVHRMKEMANDTVGGGHSSDRP